MLKLKSSCLELEALELVGMRGLGCSLRYSGNFSCFYIFPRASRRIILELEIATATSSVPG